ncbi:zinc finger protein zas1 [Achaetomium macrosporum]|uniref:Zinc finger protein zas1 n=1 Tax=Achaetomium macrosporum TaxID=79813 RepID=A0AAN7C840_9PEZI|nr:zinc finger protein zas1 [Achaetomium macrosporum]
MSGLPTSSPFSQSLIRPSLSAGSSQTSEPSLPYVGSPVVSTGSPVTHDFLNVATESLINPFEGFDFNAALDTYAGDMDLSAADLAPNHSVSMDPFNNCMDPEVFASFDCGFGSDFLDPFEAPSIVDSESPADSAMGFTSDTSSPLEPFSPASLPTAGTSPASSSPIAPAPRQVLHCLEASCTKVFSRRSELKKHERSTHRLPFRCHLPGCGKAHADQRALHRHFWTRHREYAELHHIPSERAKCPHCEYEGRGDNLKRHMKKHAR